MTGRDDEILTPEQELAREAVRKLEHVEARPDFRARLRGDFAAGRLESRIPGASAGLSLSDRWRSLGKRIGWGGRLALAIPVAAAAAWLFVLLNAGPEWQLQQPVPEVTLWIDGHEVAANDRSALAGLLAGGAKIRLTAESTLTLVSPENVALRILPGTELTLPEVPGRWWNREVFAEVANGQVLITTGDRFRGSRMIVTTPEATVEVVGTTLSVLRPEFYTCICVFEGTVRVGALGQPAEVVPPGGRMTVFPEEEIIDRGEIIEEEKRLLEEYHGCCLPEVPPGWSPPGSPEEPGP